ncbi:Transposon Ty3-I Gag-Pol polyprotein [Senna tora]|uniref:Transposon Ty3-I Gag-Pol polyprotein n=1 Tax=Senna tora TaxID=362788 RepID=A0A834SH04_9FABA|nr:Transposon Ty3-I Gag-Pol polyprotein [Senna tora]
MEPSRRRYSRDRRRHVPLETDVGRVAPRTKTVACCRKRWPAGMLQQRAPRDGLPTSGILATSTHGDGRGPATGAAAGCRRRWSTGGCLATGTAVDHRRPPQIGVSVQSRPTTLTIPLQTCQMPIMNLCDSIDTNTNQDDLHLPIGPITRAKAKRIQQAMQGLMKQVHGDKADLEELGMEQDLKAVNILQVQLKPK